MPPLNEADTRAKLIDPKLKMAGWEESQIEREHYFVKGRPVTAGRIYLVGEEPRRREPKRVDYLLRFRGEMIAVLEAKDETHPADAGLEQAKAYARLLNLPFAFSRNGHGIVEFDFFQHRSRELDQFPTPEELWHGWELHRPVPALPPVAERVAETITLQRSETSVPSRKTPLLEPPCPASVCGKELRYFQEVAIRQVLERIIRGQKRILRTMATGTGKTFTAFQIVWKLKKSGWLRKPMLFLTDRIVFRDQAYNNFGPFASGDADPRALVAD